LDPDPARCRGKLGDVAMDVLVTAEHSATTLHDMIAIPGGTFRMGSDRHYPEEAPVHRVTVDAF
jgi:formylglycine-generating enzyme